MKTLYLPTFLLFTLTSFGQVTDEFKTKAKPQTDTSAKKKGGILGGLIQTDILDNIKNAKKTIKDVKEDIKNNKEEFKRLKGEASDFSADLGLKIGKSKKKGKVKKKPKPAMNAETIRLMLNELIPV